MWCWAIIGQSGFPESRNWAACKHLGETFREKGLVPKAFAGGPVWREGKLVVGSETTGSPAGVAHGHVGVLIEKRKRVASVCWIAMI